MLRSHVSRPVGEATRPCIEAILMMYLHFFAHNSVGLSEEPVFFCVLDNVDDDIFGAYAWILTEKLSSAFEKRLFLIGVASICGGQLNEYEVA